MTCTDKRAGVKAAVTALLALLLLCMTGCAGRTKARTVVPGERGDALADVTETESGKPCRTESEGGGKSETLYGDWYGWWRMYDTSGDWAHMYGYWWDCCAGIGEDGTMLIWDEDMPKDYFLAEAELRINGRSLSCFGGTILDRELTSKSWDMTLTEDDCGTMLTISGRYKAVGSGGFSYEMYLRPWGSLWPDEEDRLPYYYEDWYLPLIESGEEMPDVLGPENADTGE